MICKDNGALHVENNGTEKVFTENEKVATIHQPRSLEPDNKLPLVAEQYKKEIVVA